MADVEEKGLDHELAHSDIHRGRLVPIGTPAEAAPAVEAAPVPTPTPAAEVTPETQPGAKRSKKLDRRADSTTEDAQDDPAAG